MADFFTRVPGPLEVMRRLGLNVPSSKQLGKFSTAVPEFVGPQADVAGMVRDAGQVMPNIRSGDYGQALANLGMAAAAIPFMAFPGTVSQVKGVTKKITDELPMDTASRMKRARGMGYDVDAPRYHQTSPAAKKEIMKGGFDPSIVGARWSDPLMPDGVFLKSSKKELPGLTGGEQTQMSLMTRAQKTKAFKNRGELESFLSKDKQWKKLRDEQAALQDDTAKLYDAIYEDKYTEKEVLTNLFGFDAKEVAKMDEVIALEEIDNVVRNMVGETSSGMRARATEVFKKKGFDSVSVAEDWGGPFGKSVTDSFVVFDEKMLRGPKAKFDPSKKTSANILAGAAGGMLFAPAFMDNE